MCDCHCALPIPYLAAPCAHGLSMPNTSAPAPRTTGVRPEWIAPYPAPVGPASQCEEPSHPHRSRTRLDRGGRGYSGMTMGQEMAPTWQPNHLIRLFATSAEPVPTEQIGRASCRERA